MDNTNNQSILNQMSLGVLPFNKLQEGREVLTVKTTSDDLIKDIHEKVTKLYDKQFHYRCPYCFTQQIPEIITHETGRLYQGHGVSLLKCTLCRCSIWLIGDRTGMFNHMPFDFFEQMKLNEKGEKIEVANKNEFVIEVNDKSVTQNVELVTEIKEEIIQILQDKEQTQQAVEEYNKIVGKRGRPPGKSEKKNNKKGGRKK